MDSGLSCDITNCQEIESVRVRRNVMQNVDLDKIKNELIEKLMLAEGSAEVTDPEFNIILNGLVKKQIVYPNGKSTQKKRIFLNTNAGVDNFTPYVLNITTTPSKWIYLVQMCYVQNTYSHFHIWPDSFNEFQNRPSGKFHLYRVHGIVINKTYGLSFKPSTTVFDYEVETDSDSTGIDPIILYKYDPDIIETATYHVDVPPYSRLQIKNHFYQYLNEIDYLLDFEIDDESTIVFADRTVSLKEIVLNNLESLPMGNINHLQLDFLNEKLVLKNFPAKLKSMDFGVEMVLERSKLDDANNWAEMLPNSIT